MTEQKIETSEINKLIFKVFGQNEDGKQLLKKLEDEFFMMPAYYAGCEEWYPKLVEGQRELIRFFKNTVKSVNDEIKRNSFGG